MADVPSMVREHVSLAPFTTLGLGGPARYFSECTTDEAIWSSLEFAQACDVRTQILGGGSNVVFADEGYNGLVLKIATRGMTFEPAGRSTIVTVAAGVVWNDLVNAAVERGLGGMECLAGIPGTVGATPIQNVGAYGQEVSDVLLEVQALDRSSLTLLHFANAECGFGYRQSRFKTQDADRFIVTQVRFRLITEGPPQVRYPDLQRYLETSGHAPALAPGTIGLSTVRDAVIAVRRMKSMVIDPADPNARSAGSFFTNPVVSPVHFAQIQQKYRDAGGRDPVPSFPAGLQVKIPAAWLVEKAGFSRGYRWEGAGISTKHALALINCGGTTKDLLRLAEEIQEKVRAGFGVTLEREPVIVSSM